MKTQPEHVLIACFNLVIQAKDIRESPALLLKKIGEFKSQRRKRRSVVVQGLYGHTVSFH